MLPFLQGECANPWVSSSSPSSQYLIQSFLGEGTFGKVVKCLKMATNRTVAIEIMEELRAFDSDRFNFVTFNDVFVYGEHVCLELEILDMSLFEFLYQKPHRSLELDEIRPILYQVSVTLQLLQSLGVVHTDLKPENIMLLDHGKQPWRIKVIDFGVACHVAKSELGDYMQTRHYRSPEIILGFPITSAIDMWSLGCIAAELFTGAVLYPGDTEHEMLRHIVQTQGHPPARLMYRGVKTRWFFHYRKKDRRRRWRLKNVQQSGETNTSAGQFNSLNDIIMLKPPRHLLDEDTAAETEDRQEFLDLLKKTLHLDIDRRISPSELLQHPFITLNHLAQNHQNSFYVKSSCEKMEVCLDQSEGFDGGQMNLSPSISGAEGPPAWFRTQEHPLILGISSQLSDSLSINDEESQQQQQQQQPPPQSPVAVKPVSPPLQVSTAAPPCQQERTGRKALRKSSRRKPRGDDSNPERDRPSSESRNTEIIQTPKKPTIRVAEIKPGRKRTWDTFVASGLRKRVKGSPESKKIKRDDSEAERKRGRKRTWDTFLASHIESKKRVKDSPERRKRDDSEAERKRGRKRTWNTFVASGLRKRVKGSPESKKIKRDDSEAERKRGRKRTWDTFLASHIESKKRVKDSPERKKRKRDDSEAERKRGRKRTWDTFLASHIESKKQINSSPERKKRKLDDSEEAERKPGRKRMWDTFLASHIESKKRVKDSPERKKRKRDDSEAERKRGRKRTWDTFVASGLRKQINSSPERKKRKLDDSEEAERKPGRKRTWDTFLASHIESKNERSGSPERKKRNTSLEEEETNTQGSSVSTRKRKRRPGDPPEGEEEPRCVKRGRY
ncbi:probable serine/threonine-protein kinase dyrk1 [Gymnodraco acuticeps]|uniref:Probable serine/threonine-protein kinase dyrk1 n=1 Tax=Gymnodraco acuticeps TaxID=8218 RepID=A0A6P8VSA0_GYMAC|nr:probable serine/threonine-protein kinase dyrk1 [Gymnodraco acuticeps]